MHACELYTNILCLLHTLSVLYSIVWLSTATVTRQSPSDIQNENNLIWAVAFSSELLLIREEDDKPT